MDKANFCGTCNKYIPQKIRKVKCFTCKTFYHVKCSGVNHKTFAALVDSGNNWNCQSCVEQKEPKNKNNNCKTKCNKCRKTIAKKKVIIKCNQCECYYHSICAGVSFSQFRKCTSWTCNLCVEIILPFATLSDEKLKLTLKGKDITFGENITLTPSFTIQSLLEKIPGTFSEKTEDYLSDTVDSKYYTPSEFLASKFKQPFSILHINIASLAAHIDDLKELLDLLDNKFDFIGISETKILEESVPLVNIGLTGYDFIHTPTKSFFGGAGLYINKDLKYTLRSDLSKSLYNIGESIFVEVTGNSNKLIVGCMYRHPSSKISSFNENFLQELLTIIGTEKSAQCAIMGDLNADLLKIDTHSDTCEFFELMSSFGFKPLIMQPTRVTSTTATVIDNIFINDIEARSIGGNITTTISDHFPQFTFLNIFDKIEPKIKVQYGRTYKNFDQTLFDERLRSLNWQEMFEGRDADYCTSSLIDSVNKALNDLAPIKKLTKKEKTY